jgi:ABC-type transporter Mla subunit MlaD
LEEFTTKVAYNIAEALDDRLNEKLVPTLNKLIETVDSMRRERGDTNEQLIKQMVEKFSNSVQGAAGNEIKAIAGTLNALNENLVPLLKEVKETHSQMQGAALYIADQIKESYEKSGKEFSQGVQGAIRELRSGISQAGDSLNSELKDAFDKAVDRLDSVVEKLDDGIGNLGNTGKNTEQMIIQSQGLLNQFKSMAGDLNAIQSNMQDSIIALKDAAGAIENAGDAARENLSHSVRMMDEFKTAANEFRKVQEDLRQVWSDYSVRFEEVDDSLENIFTQIEEGLSAYAEATSKYMGDLDKQATKVTELFSGAVRDLGEAIEDLSEVFTN